MIKPLRRLSYFVPNLSESSSRAVPVLSVPALDIDLPCRLIPSSTEGHFHLYIDKAMTWPRYVKLLEALADAGILERNYVRASIRDGATILRKPGVTK